MDMWAGRQFPRFVRHVWLEYGIHSSSCGLSSVLDCTGSIDCHPFWHLAVCKCGTSPWTLRGIRRERRWSPEHRRQQKKPFRGPFQPYYHHSTFQPPNQAELSSIIKNDQAISGGRILRAYEIPTFNRLHEKDHPSVSGQSEAPVAGDALMICSPIFQQLAFCTCTAQTLVTWDAHNSKAGDETW